MNKNALIVAGLALFLLASAGALLASSLDYQVWYPLTGPAGVGGAGTGKQLLALPYVRKAGVNNARDLVLDIGGGSVVPVAYVAKYNKTSDTLLLYNGRH